MRTLLLTRSQVETLIDASVLVDRLRVSFVDDSTASDGRARRVRAALPGGGGSATVLFPGTTSGG